MSIFVLPYSLPLKRFEERLLWNSVLKITLSAKDVLEVRFLIVLKVKSSILNY